MKDRLRILPMKALAAFCLMAGMAPVFLAIGQIFLPNAPFLWYVPAALAFIWGISGYLFPLKGRVGFALIGCAVLIAGGILFLLPLGWQTMLLIPPCVVFLLLLPPAWAKPVWEEWNSGAWIGGVALHFVGLIMTGTPRVRPAAPHFIAALVIYAFLYVLSLNRLGIRDGMHGAEKAPASLRRRNTLLVIAFFLFAVLASSWKTLGEWVDTAWRCIKQAIESVVLFLMQLLPNQSSGSGGGGGMGEMLAGLGDGEEPSLFAVIMEKVFMVLAFLLMIALLALAVRVLYKALKRAVKRILERLKRYASSAGEDYVDEAESTLNWDEKTQSIREKLKEALEKQVRPPKWEELDGRGRVRRLYGQFLRRKPEAKNKTAREAIQQDKWFSPAQADAFTQLYETARYSDHEIAVQDADQLRSTIK